MSRSDEHTAASAISRLGFHRETTREQRRREAEGMHYVGFDNPCLLLTRDNEGVKVYTNGIVGCNVLVLSAHEGTYMAHIDVGHLFRTPEDEVARHTARTVEFFRRETGCEEMVAYVVTDVEAHTGIVSALRASGTGLEVRRENEFGIAVGAITGSSRIRSNFNLVNEECSRTNILPEQLYWDELFGRKIMPERGYLRPTASSLAREAAIADEAKARADSRARAASLRSTLARPATMPIADRPYMASTFSSRAKAVSSSEGKGV